MEDESHSNVTKAVNLAASALAALVQTSMTAVAIAAGGFLGLYGPLAHAHPTSTGVRPTDACALSASVAAGARASVPPDGTLLGGAPISGGHLDAFTENAPMVAASGSGGGVAEVYGPDGQVVMRFTAVGGNTRWQIVAP